MSNLRTIEFCCKGKKCPVVSERPDGTYDIGSKEEGITTWDKGQLEDFVAAAKSGRFDDLLIDKK